MVTKRKNSLPIRKALTIFAYTKGTGSGHLTRINAVYKGFIRAKIPCVFYLYAPRSKYLDYLEPGIRVCPRGIFPKNKVDIFICDWRSDLFTESLRRSFAKTWIGLRRLGKMKASFPAHYYIVVVEPGVRGDICIWPIINTWPDELVSRSRLCRILKYKGSKKIGLLCENGAYPKHLDRVFGKSLPRNVMTFKISNSPFSDGKRDLSYYPVAKLFSATDYLVIGGGYNSVHEALSYANLRKTSIINVGGDDQAIRMQKLGEWEQGRGSQAHVLARHIVDYHFRHK